MSDEQFRELFERLDEIERRERGRLERWVDWVSKAVFLLVASAVLPWAIHVERELDDIAVFRGEGPRFTKAEATILLNDWEDKVLTRVSLLLEDQPPKYVLDQIERNTEVVREMDKAIRGIEKEIGGLRLDIAKLIRHEGGAE